MQKRKQKQKQKYKAPKNRKSGLSQHRGKENLSTDNDWKWKISLWDVILDVASNVVIFLAFFSIIIPLYFVFFCNLPYSSQMANYEEMSKIAQSFHIYDFIGEVSNTTWKEINGQSNKEKLTNIAKARTPMKILRSPAKRWLANKLWSFLDYYPSHLLNIGKNYQEKREMGMNYDAIFGTPMKNSENYINYLAKTHFESKFRKEIETWKNEIVTENDSNNQNVYGLRKEETNEIDTMKLSKIVENRYYDYNNDIISLYHLKNGSNFYIYEQLNKALTNTFFENDLRKRKGNEFDKEFDNQFDFDKNLAVEIVNSSFINYLRYLNAPGYFSSLIDGSSTSISGSRNDFDYYYYLSDASYFINDLKPIDWMHISPGTVEFSSKFQTKLGDQWGIQIEMAPFGMITAMQYQISHQFLYQMEGVRQYIICSPSNHEKLHGYPESHPRHQSSQIPPKFYHLPFRSWKSRVNMPFDASRLHSDLGLHIIDAYLVTLEPGQMVYIPPFYWYQSICIDSSITVNGWTIGVEEIFNRLSWPQAFPPILRESYQSMLNNNNSDGLTNDESIEMKQKQRLHMLAYFVRYLVDRIIKSLPHSRDIPDNIDASNVKLSEFDDSMNWDIDHYWIDKQLLNGRYRTQFIWDKFECHKFDAARCPLTGNTTETILQSIEKTAKTWALAYKQMKLFIKNENDLFDIRNVVLANNIEHIVSWVAGHKNVCLFLQCVINDRYGALYVATKEEMFHNQPKHIRHQ